jgi:hypothetical protein
MQRSFVNWYGAVGVNVQFPSSTTSVLPPRRGRRICEPKQPNKNSPICAIISRDVRTAWLGANTAYNRLAVHNNFSTKPMKH